MMLPFQEIRTTIKIFGLLLFTIAASLCSHAQENKEDDVDTLLDELFFNNQQFLEELIESDFSYNFLYSSLSYNNNTFFSGRNTGTDQFNLIPQVSYYHSSGFNASISGIYYESFTPKWDFTSLSLGYFNTIGAAKNGTYNVGYTKFFYTDGYDGFTNSLDLSIGIRSKKRTLGTSIAASYLFGTEKSYQFVSNSFVNFTLKRTPNFALRLRPQVNFIVAKQNITINKDAFILGEIVPQVFNFDVFDLLNTQINIPLSLSLKSWDFEVDYSINLPNALIHEDGLETTSYFSLSVGYLFDLNH